MLHIKNITLVSQDTQNNNKNKQYLLHNGDIR